LLNLHTPWHTLDGSQDHAQVSKPFSERYIANLEWLVVSAMGKTKNTGSVPNRPIYARISYLYQAAAHLGSHAAQVHHQESTVRPPEKALALPEENRGLSDNSVRQIMSRRLLADMRATSLKAQIRISPSMKRTICKFCNSLLIEGQSSLSYVENKSKGGKKTWADVLVIKCNTCDGMKRFPVQAPRQKRRPTRGTIVTEDPHTALEGAVKA
jgi:ribonuclease P protein subunit RPR2